MIVDILLIVVIVLLSIICMSMLIIIVGSRGAFKEIETKYNPFIQNTNNNILYLHKELELLKNGTVNADSKPDNQ